MYSCVNKYVYQNAYNSLFIVMFRTFTLLLPLPFQSYLALKIVISHSKKKIEQFQNK